MILASLANIFAHMDTNLALIIAQYGAFAYILLFLIIFLETGLVVTPFLPGDSLIFAAGALAAQGLLNLALVFILVSFAAILGDTTNYWIGKYLCSKVSNWKYVNQDYLSKTHKFYERYGGKVIIFARFIPIVRTFAPFVAGVGEMSYTRFLGYNIIGGVLWAALFVFLGFWFGNLPMVRNNFSLVIIAIIVLSLIPAIIEFIRSRKKH